VRDSLLLDNGRSLACSADIFKPLPRFSVTAEHSPLIILSVRCRLFLFQTLIHAALVSISNETLENEVWNFVFRECDILIAGETSHADLSVFLNV
jgi:hypothetical protein